jgi:hypothetical protein
MAGRYQTPSSFAGNSAENNQNRDPIKVQIFKYSKSDLWTFEEFQ